METQSSPLKIPRGNQVDRGTEGPKAPAPDAGVQRWALAFVGGKDTGNEPKSCFNCPFLYINQKRCQIHGPNIIIDRAVKKNQQYTPVCVYQTGGTPRAVEDDQVVYIDSDSAPRILFSGEDLLLEDLPIGTRVIVRQN